MNTDKNGMVQNPRTPGNTDCGVGGLPAVASLQVIACIACNACNALPLGGVQSCNDAIIHRQGGTKNTGPKKMSPWSEPILIRVHPWLMRNLGGFSCAGLLISVPPPRTSPSCP